MELIDTKQPISYIPTLDTERHFGACAVDGGIAQLVERLNGIQEVGSSNLPTSTNSTGSFFVYILQSTTTARFYIGHMPPVICQSPRFTVALVLLRLLLGWTWAILRPGVCVMNVFLCLTGGYNIY